MQYNCEPWNIALDKRLHNLVHNRKKINVAYLYEHPDTSTFRYRCYNVMCALQESKIVNAQYFFCNEIKVLMEYIEQIDMLVISRARWDWDVQDIINLCRLNNIPVIFDCDDLVFDIHKMPLLHNTLNVNHTEIDVNFWVSCIGRIEMTAKNADYFISTNEYLTDKLSKKFNKPGFIIPNTISVEQYQWSQIFRSQRKEHSGFIMGYFSGTPSHEKDFQIIAPEIAAILEELPDVQLLVVGFMNFPDYMQKFINNGQIKTCPLVDFIELQDKIANVDINLIPLVDNDFTNCKSELKFFEAGLVNVVSLATPTFVYRKCIKNKENGFLCQPTQWYQTIKDIYYNKYDLKTMAKRAHEYSIKNYYLKNVTRQIENVFIDIFDKVKCEKTANK